MHSLVFYRRETASCTIIWGHLHCMRQCYVRVNRNRDLLLRARKRADYISQHRFTWIVKSQLELSTNQADGRTRSTASTSAQTTTGTSCQVRDHKLAATKEKETVLPRHRGTLVAAAVVAAAAALRQRGVTPLLYSAPAPARPNVSTRISPQLTQTTR